MATHAIGREPRSLVSMVDSIRTGTVATGTVALFVPAAIALLVQWEQATLGDLAIAALPIALSILAWVFTTGVVRASVIVGAGFALLLGELLLTSPGGPVWAPIASATFAVIVIAVGGLPVKASIWTIAGAAALCFVGVHYFPHRVTLISTELLGGWITPLVDVVLGSSILVVLTQWRRAAERFDSAVSAVREENALVQLEREVDHARRAVDRRLHETVLNTLLVLSGSPSAEAARAQCRRDLNSLDRIEAAVPRDLASIVHEAVERVPGVETDVTITGGLAQPFERASVILRDALVELLRNVERHAGSAQARIEAQADELCIRIVVEDDGIGPGDVVPRGFGTRESVERPVQSLGGSVEWQPRSPRGLRVTMTVPTSAPAPASLGPASRDVLLGPRWARVAMNATVAVGIVAVPVAAPAFSTAPWIVAFFALQVISLGVLVLRPAGRAHGAAMVGALLAGIATIVAAAWPGATCTNAMEMHWVIFAAAGGVVLVILSLQSWSARLAVILLVVGISVFACVPYPPECIIDPLDAALENAAWIIAITLVVGVLAMTADRARVHAEANLRSTAALRTSNAAAAAAADRWNVVGPVTRTLLREVADGRLGVGTPEVRQLAMSEESILRSRLEIGRLTSQEARESWERLLSAALTDGLRLKVRVRGAVTEGPRDPRAFAGVDHVIRHCHGTQLDVAILEDSLLCSVDCTESTALPPPWRLLEVTDTGQRILEWPGTTVGAHSPVTDPVTH